MLQEMPWLLAHFDRVLMVSYYGAAELMGIKCGTMPEDLRRIAAKGSRLAFLAAIFRAPFASEFWRELGRLAHAKRLAPLNAIRLLLFAIRGQKLHHWLERVLHGCDLPQTTLYSFWMSYDAYAAALSKKKHGELRFLARGHSFDIDEEKNAMNPYLMKGFIAEAADGLFLISECMKEVYLRYMRDTVAREKIRVVWLGSQGSPVEGIKEPPLFAEGRLKLVSCAIINPYKQLPVLIDALARWEGMPLHWLHMGGGLEEAAVRAYAAERLGKRENVSWEMTGEVENKQVQQVYTMQAFDVFVNTSSVEGVPVSIMEAMRFGVPVIAPRIGGIPELVDDKVGMLYDPQKGADGVLEALGVFAALPKERIMAMRRAAQERWNERCRSEALLPLVFEE